MDEMTDIIARVAELHAAETATSEPARYTYSDFYAHLPSGQYLFVPSMEFWPAKSVNAQLENVGEQSASAWIAENRAIHQLFWHPNEPRIVAGKLAQDGGWIESEAARVFNRYRPPTISGGDPAKAKPWLDHVRHIYPDDADHIITYLAFKTQNPGIKVNHALILGGNQGVGKDTLLEPVRTAVGEWNVQDITPAMVLRRFNPWIMSVLCVVSEARDLGDTDRFSFYEHMKTYTAAPPMVLTCDQKHIREQRVFNVMGVVITTNHKTGGIYLSPDDRRHYFAWSCRVKEEFSESYWRRLYDWFESGGRSHVAAYLRQVNLSAFDPKAPPPKTEAWHACAAADVAADEMELLDAIESLGTPAVVTIEDIKEQAIRRGFDALRDFLEIRRNHRAVPHKMERGGYTPVRNRGTKDGRWKVSGRNRAVYGNKMLTYAEQVAQVQKLPRLVPVHEVRRVRENPPPSISPGDHVEDAFGDSGPITDFADYADRVEVDL